MKISVRRLVIAGLAASTMVSLPMAANAYSSYDGGDGAGREVSYINPDTGAATVNPDVDPNSSCFSPDQKDDQALSTPTKNNNVHNDACFLDIVATRSTVPPASSHAASASSPPAPIPTVPAPRWASSRTRTTMV